MEYEEFECEYELSDYGKIRFEFDDSNRQMDMTAQRRKAMLRHPGFYYLLTMVFLLIAWFVGSLISNAIKYGFIKSLGMHADGFFVLFVMLLIVLLSVFGGWGKLSRWAGNRNKFSGFNKSEQEREDAFYDRKSSVQIYEDWLVLINRGQTRVFDLHKVEKVILNTADELGKTWKLSFVSTSGLQVFSSAVMPREKLTSIQLKKIFGEKLEIERPVKKAVVKPEKALADIIAPAVMISLCIFAGIGAILMHYLVDKSVPIFLGVFFFFGGALGLCATLSFVHVLKDVVVPLLFGILFLIFPFNLIKLIYLANGTEFTLKNFFGVFNPLGAALIFFGWLGSMFVFISIKTAIDYIRYRERKK